MTLTSLSARKGHRWTESRCRACGISPEDSRRSDSKRRWTAWFCVCWKMRLPKRSKEK